MNRTFSLGLLIALTACLIALPVGAQDPMGHDQDHSDSRADSADVAGALSGFHSALAAGDSARAVSLLAPGARILEGGGVETRAEYAGHHLGADMAFAAALPRERGSLDVVVRGEVAWVTSTNAVQGSYRGRDIDSRGGELAVLARHEGEWRIEAISWSSR